LGHLLFDSLQCLLPVLEPLVVRRLKFYQFRFSSDDPLAVVCAFDDRARQLSLNVLQSSNVIAASMGTKLALVLFQHCLLLCPEINLLQAHFGGPVRQLRLKMLESNIPLAILCFAQCRIALCTKPRLSEHLYCVTCFALRGSSIRVCLGHLLFDSLQCLLPVLEPLVVRRLKFYQFRFSSDDPLAVVCAFDERARQLSLKVLQSSNVIAASMGPKLALVLFQHCLLLCPETGLLQAHVSGPVRQLRFKMLESNIPLAMLCFAQCRIALCTKPRFF